MASARGTPSTNAASASTPEPVPTSRTASGVPIPYGVVERLQAQSGGRMQSRAEGRGVDQSERAGFRFARALEESGGDPARIGRGLRMPINPCVPSEGR